MKEQPHWNNVLTVDFFTQHYVKERKSYPQLRELLLSQGYNVAVGTIHKYAKRLGFGRTISEGKRNIEENPLDWSRSYLDERTIEAIDGFLLGDGNLACNATEGARLKCGVQYEEFCRYLMAPFALYNAQVKDYPSESMSSGVVWHGSSYCHPDLLKQYERWYPVDKKQPPDDVRITPTSVMMWYLGDGSLVADEKANTVTLRLSTDGFLPERVEFLASKFKEKEIACHRNGDNRIMIEARGIARFFDFIGRKPPLECYAYKFELPAWRFEAKRMKEVADECGLDYNVLSYWVKSGQVECFRTTPKGKPRFLPQHIESIKRKACL